EAISFSPTVSVLEHKKMTTPE
ncbi:hypothetical protein EVA_13129, partial [gut metagenome]